MEFLVESLAREKVEKTYHTDILGPSTIWQCYVFHGLYSNNIINCTYHMVYLKEITNDKLIVRK